MTQHRYQFLPMTASDLSLIEVWLDTPEVVQWWGDPKQQLTLVSEDLGNTAMDQFIVTYDTRKFAYLQCYDLSAWPDSAFGAQPPGTRAIDQFIGEPDMINRGHGSAFIRMFVRDFLPEDVPRVITDPDPGNVRAIRAYEKAGFGKGHVITTQDGPALLMVCTR